MTIMRPFSPVCVLIVSIALFIFFVSGVSADTQTSVFGFRLGMSVKDAKRIVKRAKREILMDEKDNKGIRTVMFEGMVVEDLPFPSVGKSQSELEFFKGKLMSYSLVIEPEGDVKVIGSKVLEHLVAQYGDYKKHESLFFYDVWMWEGTDLKLILSVDGKKGRLKIDYIYLPIEKEKIAEELDKKRKGEPEDPARQMFIEGNYSKPRNYYPY